MLPPAGQTSVAALASSPHPPTRKKEGRQAAEHDDENALSRLQALRLRAGGEMWGTQVFPSFQLLLTKKTI